MNEIRTMEAPKMMTIRETAKAGILPEHTLRVMVKTGQAPHIMIGNKALINVTKLIQQLEAL